MDLSNFDTSLVTDMGFMFFLCSSLTSLDLSNFNTSIVKKMMGMFGDCSSLISLKIYNFDTSQVTNMNGMFCRCSSLISLNLSNFNTLKVKDMSGIFGDCSTLTSLDSTDNILSKINNIFVIFDSCINLEYINLINFDERQLTSFANMFTGVPENVVICINENITQEKILPQIISKNCSVIDCSDDWKSKQKKIISNTNECIESCDNSYEYNGKCVESCPKGLLYDDNNNTLNTCKCELDKCLISPK